MGNGNEEEVGEEREARGASWFSMSCDIHMIH